MSVQCSILICTYNRAEVLRETLACLIKQISQYEGVELLVVDNASPDNTEDVIESFPEAKYFHEACLGLSHARNRAVREATHENLIFIDDDVVPEPDWLAAYLDFLNQRHESVTFWGGPVTPFWTVEPQPELNDTELHYMSRAWSLVDPQAEPEKIQSLDQLMPIGANFGGLRSIFIDLKFDPSLGRQGLNMTSLEEIDLLHRAMKRGYVGMWVKGASLGHRISAERLSKSYLAKFYYGFGRSEKAYRSSHSIFELFGRCLRSGISSALNSIGRRNSSSFRHFVKWHYYRGQLAQALRGTRSSR